MAGTCPAIGVLIRRCMHPITARARSSAGARAMRSSRGRRRCSRRCCRGLRSISTRPAPADLRALFAAPATSRSESGFGGGEHLVAEARAQSGHRLHRHRAVHQRHGEGAGRDRRPRAHQHPPASRRRHRCARLAAGREPRALRSALSGSLAEAAPLEAAFRAGRQASRRSRASCGPAANSASSTDWPDYAAWTLRHLLRSPDFEWTAERADDWRLPWPGFTSTRYEAKAKREGRVPCYLIFRRR